MERIVPQELELSTTKVPPIHSYGNFASPKRHCRHGKKIAYSRNAKIAIVEMWRFTLSITLLLPVLHYPYLVILERVDLDYTQRKFGKNRLREFEIIKKSNLANAKSPIQDWQFGKTSIAYTMPILYNAAILAPIWDHNFAQNFSPKIFPLTSQIW